MAWPQDLQRILLMGIGATAVLDAWLLLLRRFGVPGLNFDLLGRWVGHLWRGQMVHAAIARAPAVAGERAWGWIAHYAVGIAFAALLVGWLGPAWARQPSLAPALAFGLGTVVAPLFVMQPAMGAGWAGSRTAAPLRNSLRSLANHAVFGLGLYLSASVLALLLP